MKLLGTAELTPSCPAVVSFQHVTVVFYITKHCVICQLLPRTGIWGVYITLQL